MSIKPLLFTLALSGHLMANSGITHSPIDYYVADKRIQINSMITSPSPIREARVYFKDASQPNYAFTKMSCNNNFCSGTIPAPSANIQSLEYRILSQDNSNRIAKSEAYTAPLKASTVTPTWQTAIASAIPVFTELSDKHTASEGLSGFEAGVALIGVPLADKLGLVAGITSASDAGLSNQANSSSNQNNYTNNQSSLSNINDARSNYNDVQQMRNNYNNQSNNNYNNQSNNNYQEQSNSYADAAAVGAGAAAATSTTSGGIGALGWTGIAVAGVAGVSAISSSSEDEDATGSCVIEYYYSSTYDYVFIAQNYPQSACNSLESSYSSYSYYNADFFTSYKSCSDYSSAYYCSDYDYGY